MIETERLILRGWREDDRALFHRLGNDPWTMRYLGPLRSQDDDDQAFDRQRGFLASHKTCAWLVERKADGAPLGVCGAKPAPAGLPIAGEMEILWRFAAEHQRQGYALEAARASLSHVWAATMAPRVVAITVNANVASWTLMERLGMVRVRGGDFDHPFVPDDSPLKRHVLYRIARPVA
ncbi:RimJ/RimL family protein N-acetyltransferase [Sphingomonas insulae]|uniref:GNAT family N-acetyltransferase n=1 Tax=Sphingomonas insulae TaxID=424800 RepID=A0ABP3SU24_9SPHN|nr:GNAT family N-acetyltransferase [Sphingomonas insulae]NIJ29232.1 RimJ/RimL family protein N-acetyltransferase [Sphingomonas insulae]